MRNNNNNSNSNNLSAAITSKVLRVWLCLEDIARELSSGQEEDAYDDDNDWASSDCSCCFEVDDDMSEQQQQQQHDVSTSNITCHVIPPACSSRSSSIDGELKLFGDDTCTTSQVQHAPSDSGLVLLEAPPASSSSPQLELLSVGVHLRRNNSSVPNDDGNALLPVSSPFQSTSSATSITHYEPLAGQHPAYTYQQQQQRRLLARTNHQSRVSQQRRRRTRRRYFVPKSCMARTILKSLLFLLGSALIVSYAVVHVHIIQEGDVFYTAWFYEWFLIPILLSFVVSAPLHRALGGFDNNDGHHPSHNNNPHNAATISTTTHNDSNDITIGGCCCGCCCWRYHRLQLLQNDVTTQRSVMAVILCYVLYIVGDAAFFIPLMRSHQQPSAISIITFYPMYLMALMFNIGFIYQGFFLSILAMRAMVVRLNELQDNIHQVLILQHTTTTVTREQILQWTLSYQDLRQDMQSLSDHFGVRMVLGVTMFVVEVTNTILNVWEAVGSTLTKGQTCLLLLTYTSSAAILIMVTFQTAYTATTCQENIGPRLAMLSLRTNNSSNHNTHHHHHHRDPNNDNNDNNPTNSDNNSDNNHHQYDVKAELNVLAQTFMQAPIRLRVGNFHITAEYANALAAWFFGLLLVVFGMKLPNY